MRRAGCAVAIAAALATVATIPACGPRDSVVRDSASSGTAAARRLIESRMRNAVYVTSQDSARHITLAQGRYEDTTAHVSLTWQGVAYGDLNGDGVDDAVVHLASHYGGSGMFSDLVPVVADQDSMRIGRATLLGDRIRLDTLRVEHGAIRVVMVTQGPNEPMCCGTLHQTREYTLRGDSIALVRVTHVLTRDTSRVRR